MSSHNFLPLTYRPFKKVLIANRGEIAVRIIQACRDLGLSPYTVYSTADLHSKHVALSDKAICIGAAPSSDSYLNIQNIIQAARDLGAEAIHPGLGFLAESAHFANEVLKAGFIWIGPSPRSIHIMGDKITAKRKVLEAGVPCSPGKNEALKNISEFKEVAHKIGLPLILKAAAGGGGRGIRVVHKQEDLSTAFETCTREALDYFGNADVYCERFIEKPRHIEIQILADGHGNIVHLFERDCTIQRRHQKLIEEAPSSYISHETRLKMGDIAVKAAKSVSYVGAGTVEFILESPEKFYFMEMNTRIQVEHPITELITGIDLVQAQFKIAMGEKLDIEQKDIHIHGWAIEARINSEDPFNGFRPDPHTITHLEFPIGAGVRIDSHIYPGYKIPEYYDSMLAKLIVHGSDRNNAINKLKRALNEFHIDGVNTTIPYHQALLDNPIFCEGIYSTRFIEEHEHLLCEAESLRPDLSVEEAAAIAIRVAEIKNHNEVSRYAIREPETTWSQAQRLENTRR